MSLSLRLRIHVSEPFDFERENPSPDLFGTTADHMDSEVNDWLIELEEGFIFHEERFSDMLLSPRYVGERLSRVFDSILGVPVRIAHRTAEGWHFAMTGLISIAPTTPEPEQGGEDRKEDLI